MANSIGSYFFLRVFGLKHEISHTSKIGQENDKVVQICPQSTLILGDVFTAIWTSDVLDSMTLKTTSFRLDTATVTRITGIRWDTKVFELPPNLKPNQKRGRGRPPKYGHRINMANKASDSQGFTKLSL